MNKSTLRPGDTVFIHWFCAPPSLATIVELLGKNQVMVKDNCDDELCFVDASRCIPVYTHDTRLEMLRVWNAWTAVLFAARLWNLQGMNIATAH